MGSSTDSTDCNEEPRWQYIVAGEGLRVGTVLRRHGDENDMDLGVNTRCRRLSIPVGLTVYDVAVCQIRPDGRHADHRVHRSTRVKTAGASARVVRHDEERRMTRVRLPSGEERWRANTSYATLGKVAAGDHRLEKIGKAGTRRRQGIRPTVRGCAMNPIDHPHGGRTKGGRHDVTPWAKIAKGQPTRRKDQRSVFVVKTAREARRA